MDAIEDDTIAHLSGNMQVAVPLPQTAFDKACLRLAAFKQANKCPVNVD